MPFSNVDAQIVLPTVGRDAGAASLCTSRQHSPSSWPSTQHIEHLLHVPGSVRLFPALEEASELLNLALHRRSLVQPGAEVLGRGGTGGLDE